MSEEPTSNVQNSGVGEKPDAEKSILLCAIAHTAAGEPRRKEVIGNSEDEKKLDAEVRELFAADTDHASAGLSALFPAGVPTDATFYARLIDLHLRLGWSEAAHRGIGLLFSQGTEKLSLDEAEALLRLLPEVQSPFFFQLLRSLDVLLSRRELRSEFAAEWFPALIRRIGNDLAAGGFWNALGAYCRQYPKAALQALTFLLDTTTDEGISAAAYILGALRGSDLDRDTAAEFLRAETELTAASTAPARAIYNRSWVQSAWRGQMKPADVELLTNRMARGSEQEREQVFGIVCRALLSPAMSSECLDVAWTWLRENVSADIPPAAKYDVVDFAAKLAPEKRRDAADLIVAVQKILPEHKGIWQRIEQFLVSVLETDRELFGELLIRLSIAGGENWLRALNEPGQFDWFVSSLQNTDVSLVIGQLILSEDSKCREIGLTLFDSVQLTILPAELLQQVGEQQVANAFYQLQRSVMHGPAIARFMVLLIPIMERASESLQEDFYDELVLQLKNFGSCRDEFGRHAADYPILKKAIDEVEQYFNVLKPLQQSTINQIQVPGFARAARLYARRFANEVSQGAEELSVFAKLFKNVRLLYGREWRTFHGGRLGESSDLEQVSTSVEFPRMEFLDPERMQLRRLHASLRIRELAQARDGGA